VIARRGLMAVRAYVDLESAGFVTSRVGKGTFVAAGLPATERAALPRRGVLPWASIVAPHAVAEPLGRFDRLARAYQRTDLVQLGNMHPSAELLPNELFQRCLDHTLRQLGSQALTYGPREGLPRLRALIAEDLGRQGMPAIADDVDRHLRQSAGPGSRGAGAGMPRRRLRSRCSDVPGRANVLRCKPREPTG
jgi:DNA-binding transcriptional MocR family regulator